MKSILLWLLIGATSAFGAAPPSFRSVPNYLTENQCLPFSRSAVDFLRAHGLPAHQIFYRWHQIGGGTGYHAAVLFKHEGRYYFMDNWREKPRVVAGETDLGCVNRMHNDGHTHCNMVDEQFHRVEPRKLSEIFGR